MKNYETGNKNGAFSFFKLSSGALVATTEIWLIIDKINNLCYHFEFLSMYHLSKLQYFNLPHPTVSSPPTFVSDQEMIIPASCSKQSVVDYSCNTINLKMEAEGSEYILSPSCIAILRPVWAAWHYLKNLKAKKQAKVKSSLFWPGCASSHFVTSVGHVLCSL